MIAIHAFCPHAMPRGLFWVSLGSEVTDPMEESTRFAWRDLKAERWPMFDLPDRHRDTNGSRGAPGLTTNVARSYEQVAPALVTSPKDPNSLWDMSSVRSRTPWPNEVSVSVIVSGPTGPGCLQNMHQSFTVVHQLMVHVGVRTDQPIHQNTANWFTTHPDSLTSKA